MIIIWYGTYMYVNQDLSVTYYEDVHFNDIIFSISSLFSLHIYMFITITGQNVSMAVHYKIHEKNMLTPGMKNIEA